MPKTKLTNEQLIDLLADGNKIPEICELHGMKKYTLERRMEKLKNKYECRTVAQLVFKLKTVVYAPVPGNRIIE